MKRLLFMTGMLALVVSGCATYERDSVGGTGPGADVIVGEDTDTIRGLSAGNDRINTGTETARGLSDLGAASPGDAQQREPIDPRYQRVVPWTDGYYGPNYR